MKELPIPTIYGSITGLNGSTSDICGSSSSSVRQMLISAYAPRISVVSSASADSIVKNFGNVKNVSHFFSYFENVFAHGDDYNKILESKSFASTTTASTSNNLAGSGCVRFVGDVLDNLRKNSNGSDDLFDSNIYTDCVREYVDMIDNNIKSMSDNSPTYQTYKKDYAHICNLQNSIYLKMISLLHSSEHLSLFECFNHPIMNLVVISGNDTKEEIEDLITPFADRDIPRWVDPLSILDHILILVEQDDSDMLQNALKIQEDMKINFQRRSTIVLIDSKKNSIGLEDTGSVKLHSSLFNSGSEDFKKFDQVLVLNREVFEFWKRPLQELVSKDLIIFMNSKIKEWNDEIVAPRTSLTGRLFSGRKWGGNSKPFFSFGSNQSSNDSKKENNITSSYDPIGGFYLGGSSEMILRKLGDWYFMLGDYKNAYTTYELVKKDMINDKAYAHLSSLQEYIIYSLLLGASNNSTINAQPITSKMISTVINPMLDSSFYSYLSRCNLKAYTLRLTIIAAELYFILGQSNSYNTLQNNGVSNISNSEIYFIESMNLFKKVIDSKLLNGLSNGYLMQRIAYVYLAYYNPVILPKVKGENQIATSYYETENENKLQISNSDIEKLGIPRNRKLILWLLLSAKELNANEQTLQSQLIVWRIDDQLNEDNLNAIASSWLQRKDGLLFKIKKKLSD